MNWLMAALLCLLSGIGISKAEINPMLLAYHEELRNLSLLLRGQSSSDVQPKVHFFLYTRLQKEGKELFPGHLISLKKSKYNPRRPTKILVHGFFSYSTATMEQSIKDNFLQNLDVNVILVDWGSIAVGLNYNSISRSTRPVGYYVATLIDTLISYGAKHRDIHLIGHSLGAHLSGFAGAAVKGGKIGRITGLDPAKPNFHNAHPNDRLDPSDAQFVDCIHTCGGLLGLHEPICTVDFYPNGGTNLQPGCSVLDFGKCSHQRAYEIFAESIHPFNKFPAINCPSLKSVKNKVECKPSNVQMGCYTTWGARGIFHSQTGNKPPLSLIK